MNPRRSIFVRFVPFVPFVTLAVTLAAQTQPPPTPPQNPPAGAQQPQPGRGGRGGGGGAAIQVMSLSTTAWQDGGRIPVKHAQGGGEVSPPLSWANVPEGVGSFVLIVRDLDALRTQGGVTTDLLHWIVWNIPGTARALPEGIPQGSDLPDGSRQISATGPSYRGPAAPASGPDHHYAFELYAVDGPVEVPAVGASPGETRAAVLAAIASRVRGKATLIGLFKRGT
jgi:Raf kinase inhibitor-like YbhB/YbcL family protein